MIKKSESSSKAGPEQILYANILRKGMLVGLAVLFITFTIYVFGIIDPYIPLDKISGYWGVNVDEYLYNANIKNGWSWVGMLSYSEFANFIGIAMLAGVSIVCYIGIIPLLLKNGDTTYAILAMLEALILSLAASGILEVGH